MSTEVVVLEVHTRPENKILRRGNIYLRPLGERTSEEIVKDPTSALIFDWNESRVDTENLIRVGEVMRLQTVLPTHEGEMPEVMTHRVVQYDCSEYLETTLIKQIEAAKQQFTASPVTRVGVSRETYLSGLLSQLEKVRKNRTEPPVLVLSGFSGTGTTNETWALAMSGRRVYNLSHMEDPHTDTSRTQLDKWQLPRYVEFLETVTKQLSEDTYAINDEAIDEWDAVGWSAGAVMLVGVAASNKVQIRRLVLHNPGGIFDQHWLKVAAGFLHATFLEAFGRTGRELESLRRITDALIPPPFDEEVSIKEANLQKMRFRFMNVGQAIKIAKLVAQAISTQE